MCNPEAALAMALSSLLAVASELEKTRTTAARWESEAVLRAATIANDLTLRVREAELAERHLRRRVQRALRSDYPSVEAMKERLRTLTAADGA